MKPLCQSSATCPVAVGVYTVTATVFSTALVPGAVRIDKALNNNRMTSVDHLSGSIA